MLSLSLSRTTVRTPGDSRHQPDKGLAGMTEMETDLYNTAEGRPVSTVSELHIPCSDNLIILHPPVLSSYHTLYSTNRLSGNTTKRSGFTRRHSFDFETREIRQKENMLGGEYLRRMHAYPFFL